MNSSFKVMLVDLNNFARYPTIPIGYLAAILRNSGADVTVFAPLMIGVKGVVRETRPRMMHVTSEIINFLAATSKYHWIRAMREFIASRSRSEITKRENSVFREFARELARCRPDAVMISTYLMYRALCERITSLCAEKNIPVVVGGPYFANEDVVDQWIGMNGLTGLIAGELEIQAPQIVLDMLQGADLSGRAGVFTCDQSGNKQGCIAMPNSNLDSIPFPDYSDFPWSEYPNRIVPVITGRGCQWGICTFCSDVESTAGRTFRSRTPEKVIEEITYHHRTHKASLFIFTDLKLNSNVTMWRTIINSMQGIAPGAKWISSVHVGNRQDEGLSREDLKAAAESGCVRLTTGLETGSWRIARKMRKGTRRDRTSQFLQDAASSGISCRCTMVVGYPDEVADDIYQTVEFLEAHKDAIERVSLNRFQITTGTSFHRAIKQKPQRFKGMRILHDMPEIAAVSHYYQECSSADYLRAVKALQCIVYQINRRELSPKARAFEGAM